MLFDCFLVFAYVVVCARLLPQHVFESRRLFGLPLDRTVRVWEEASSLVWYTWNIIYMMYTHVDTHFLFHSSLTLDSTNVHSSDYDTVRLLLGCNIAYYVGMLTVALWTPRRRDWKQMVSHHVITIALMLVAYFVGFYDVSVFVLFINAVADVFLSSSRIAFDVKHPLQTPLFACFVFIHVFVRLIYYPYKVWHCFFSSMNQYQSAFDYLPGLCTIPLWLLYLFWTPEIFRVCWRRAVRGVEDVDKSVRQKKSFEKK